MGDRSVVGVRSRGHETLYLYSHWGGDEQERTLAHALVHAQARWNDESYATRILVSHYVAEEWSNETGYGLSVGWWTPPDYEYLYEVDWQTRHVYKVYLDFTGQRPSGNEEEYTFHDFIQANRMKGVA